MRQWPSWLERDGGVALAHRGLHITAYATLSTVAVLSLRALGGARFVPQPVTIMGLLPSQGVPWSPRSPTPPLT